jgi:hypothetical protein
MPENLMPWLKLWHEYLDKAKIQILSESLRARHINLLCVACKENDNGRLPNIKLVAHMLHLSEAETLATLNALAESGLIENRAKGYYIHDWDEWQSHKSPAAIRQKRVREKRNALRNGYATEADTNCVTRSATRALAPTLDLDLRSESQEEGTGGKPPNGVTNPDAVRGVADAAEARWPAQSADMFVGDLCRTFDWRLVAHVLTGAFDKDPRKLPRAWIRSGCQNEFNRGWKPDDPTTPAGQAVIAQDKSARMAAAFAAEIAKRRPTNA